MIRNLFLTKNAPVDVTKKAPALAGQKDPMAYERRYASVSFTAATEKELAALGENIPDGYVAGWASTSGLDLYNHKVMRNAFAKSIQKRGLNGPRGIKLLLDHEWSQLAGSIKKLEYRGDNLWIEAQLNLNVSYVRDRYEMAKMLGGLSFSVGFMLEKYSIKVDETNKEEEYLEISQGDLYEISIVPFPGNEEAEMTFVKSGEGAAPASPVATVSEFEKRLVALGLVKSRNDAHRVSVEIRNASAAFQKSRELFQHVTELSGDADGGTASGEQTTTTDPDPVVKEIPQPVLAKDKLENLALLIAKMKATLAQ